MATEKIRPGVVVTGAAGDMGAALCDSFLDDGFAVFGADIAAPRGRDGLTPVVADVTDRTAVFALAERASAESRLSVWVNCAGIFEAGAVAQAGTEAWSRIIAVNLTGTFHGCAAALAVMSRTGGGRIVNAGSLSGHVGGTGVHPAYGASKAGVHALTKTYALEGARHGIACNAVAPGVLEGRMGGQFADGQLERLARANPMRRLGRIDEAVEAIRFLADPVRASYLNGVVLPVNGGAYMPS
ncbi:MAG: SDR family oxidoreductase [Alphaproteobacteria bacterium]|nr:SDR family oxidoreductase [Alphaproteobacteria bacterium]